MKRTTAVKLLIALALAGSVVTFYATNLILSDVSNMFYMTLTHDVISSLPCFLVALDFVLATLYVTRFYSKPRFKQTLTLLYSRILLVFSVLGLACTLYTGLVLYGSMLAPYPFPGATILFLLWHGCMIVHSIQIYKTGSIMTEGTEWRKLRLSYILYTIMLCGMVFFAYNRFGAFLLAPLYIQWSSFYLTFPFYLSLLLPMALLVHMIFYTFKLIDQHPNGGIIHISIVFAANILLAFAVMYTGYHNTQFISAISPALAIERLLTLPIDTVLHHAFVAIFSIYEFGHAIIYKKNHPVSKQ